MTPVDERVQWLTTAMDEVQRVAEGAQWAGDERWRTFHRHYDDRWIVEDTYDEGVAEVRAHAADSEAVARHIALHDPRSALARVEADRQILVRHIWRHGDRDQQGQPACPTCATAFGLILWPCPTFQAVLSAYRFHPGFREEWLA